MNLPEIPFKKLSSCLNDKSVKSATYFHSPTEVATLTRQFKPDKRNSRETLILTVGKPNYLGRIFVASCKKAGEPFPVKKIQLRRYPAKK
jgi:hypothetical protein